MDSGKNISIEELDLFFTNIIRNSEDCAKDFQNGNISKGSIALVNLVDHFNIFVNLLSTNSFLEDEEVNIDIVNEKLREITDGIENNDFTLAGDLIEYELIPIVNKLFDKICKL